MDGGGRFLRPLGAGFSGRAGYCAPSSPRLFVALQRRLPRLFGTALMLVFFASVGITGAIQGGHVQAFRDRYGEPRHALARFIGLGLDQVTISGIAQLTEAEVLSAA